MFAKRYFGARYFPPRYFGGGDGTLTIIPGGGSNVVRAAIQRPYGYGYQYAGGGL